MKSKSKIEIDQFQASSVYCEESQDEKTKPFSNYPHNISKDTNQ